MIGFHNFMIAFSLSIASDGDTKMSYWKLQVSSPLLLEIDSLTLRLVWNNSLMLHIRTTYPQTNAFEILRPTESSLVRVLLLEIYKATAAKITVRLSIPRGLNSMKDNTPY